MHDRFQDLSKTAMHIST